MQSYYALKACLECQLHRQGNRLIIIGVGTLYYVLCTAAVWSTGTLCALGGVSFLSGCSFRRFKDVCLRCFLEMYVRNKNTHKLFTHREEYNSNHLVFEESDERRLSSHWNYFCLQTLVSWKDLPFDTCLRSLKCERTQIFFSEEKFTQNRFLVEKAEFDSWYFCSHEAFVFKIKLYFIYILKSIILYIKLYLQSRIWLMDPPPPLWTPFLNCFSYIYFLLNLLYFILIY